MKRCRQRTLRCPRRTLRGRSGLWDLPAQRCRRRKEPRKGYAVQPMEELTAHAPEAPASDESPSKRMDLQDPQSNTPTPKKDGGNSPNKRCRVRKSPPQAGRPMDERCRISRYCRAEEPHIEYTREFLGLFLSLATCGSSPLSS